MKPTELAEIKKQLQGIANARFNSLEEITIDTLDFNPFLLKLIGLNSAEEIAEFMVSQRTERSIVTSYGQRIQSIIQVVAERGTGVEGADICKEKDGRRYYIQIKSGPNTPDKDIMKQINTLLQSATRRNRGSVALLGMTYGKRERVSNIIQGYSQIDWLIGHEFWDFIADKPGFSRELFELIAEIVEHYSPDGGVPYLQRRQQKIEELTQQIRKKYGARGPKMWNKLFEDNM